MRMRLAVAFAAGISVLTLGAGAYLQGSMKRAVYSGINKELMDGAKLTLHKMEEDHSGISKELLDLPDNVYLRIMDPGGKVLLESRDLATLLPQAASHGPLAPWRWAETPLDAPVRIKTLLVPRSGGWFLIARDMHPEEAVIRSFRRTMAELMTLIPFVAFCLGYFLVRVAFRSARSLQLQVEAIRPDSLDKRIDAASLPVELEPLATRFNQLMDRLQEAFARLSSLNAEMAHELRTPIHGLRLQIEAILAGRSGSGVEEALGDVAESLEGMSSLLERMLLLARVENPSHHLEVRTCFAKELLLDAIAPFEALSDLRNVAIHAGCPDDFTITVDRDLIRRGLHNLVSNALRHAPPGSRIELDARGEAGMSVLEVRDQGPGIPLSVIAHLGERFLRADDSRSRESGGAGLGLAIVQGILKLHGGSLELSGPESSGGRARMVLPQPD